MKKKLENLKYTHILITQATYYILWYFVAKINNSKKEKKFNIWAA